MATPVLLPGNRFRLYRSTSLGPPEVFAFVCLANTISLTQTNEYEDTTSPDCANPTAIPVRQSIKRSSQWALSFSGTVDATKMATFRTDVNAESAQRYQVLFDQNLAGGGGAYAGAIFFESFAETKTNNGLVAFTVTARGDGILTWTDAAS
jgi:hypothetical protein